MADDPLISIEQARSLGIERLRLPRWADAMDHIKIDFVAGRLGPWVHLYCPMNVECNGRDPVDMMLGEFDAGEIEWEPYRGPTPDSEAYRAEVAGWAGRFNR